MPTATGRPTTAQHESARSSTSSLPSAAAIAAVPPLVIAWGVHAPSAAFAACTVGAAAVAVAFGDRHSRTERWRLVVAALACVGVAAVAGRSIGLSLGLSAALVARLGHRERTAPAGSLVSTGTPIALSATVVAALSSPSSVAVAVLATQGVGLLVVARDRAADQLMAIGEALLKGWAACWRAVGAGLLAVLAGLVLTVTWVPQRLMGVDPLAPDDAVVGWRSRGPSRPRPRSTWTVALVRPRRAPGPAWRRAGAAAIALTVLAVGGFLVTIRLMYGGQDPPPECPVSCVVFADDADWDDVFNETARYTEAGHFDAVTAYRFDDVSGDHLNVTRGVRDTWTPPPCECRRVRVWWFGGSTAFGFWQRDEQSLPSAVAKAALERGITLDVVNHATPGWTSGQGVRAFAQLVASTPPDQLPDVVMFLDGANDYGNQLARDRRGMGADESEPTSQEVALDELTRSADLGALIAPAAAASPATSSPPATTSRQLPTSEMIGHAISRYLRNVHLGQLLGDSIDARTIFMWQPNAAFSPVSASGSLALEGRHEWQQAMGEASRQLAGTDVSDLSFALADVREPVWGDLVHTNERGAALMGAAIVDAHLDQLRAAATGSRSSR